MESTEYPVQTAWHEDRFLLGWAQTLTPILSLFCLWYIEQITWSRLGREVATCKPTRGQSIDLSVRCAAEGCFFLKLK